MTFEEFLIRKKIDPAQLKTAEPALFSEFNSHYDQMGEKSFDHSKKFWFNKLRRSYHLKDEPKAAKDIVEINQLASQAEPLISPTLVATGYKPRFKPGASTLPVVPAQPEEKTATTDIAKPAYKPRFKAQISGSAEEKTLAEGFTEGKTENTISEEQPKPAYKPRFKPSPAKPPQKED
ncbi:MAG: hypothetical protein ACYCZO_08200 [Daejeonella sp.]